MSAKAFQTATTTVSGASPNPTDTNSNPNLFGNSGPTPVIPAFVLSGVLLIVLVCICTWRRMLRTRTNAGLVPRYGPFGISFVPMVAEMDQQLRGGRRRAREERDVALGPKPELWDAYTRREGWAEDKGGHGLLLDEEASWKGMKPLSLSLGSDSTPNQNTDSVDGHEPGSPITPTTASNRQTYLMRKLLRLKAKRTERKADPVPLPPPEPINTTHDVEVSVLIRMPSPTRSRPRQQSSDPLSVEKEKERADAYEDADDDDDFNFALGVAVVPLVITDGNDSGR